MQDSRDDELRRADLAEAGYLGKEFGLGAAADVTRVRVWQLSPGFGQSVSALASLVLFGLIMAIALAGSAPVAAVIFGAITVSGSAALWLLWRRARSQAGVRRYFQYQGGIIELCSGAPEPRVLRWEDVDSVTLVFNDPEDSRNGLSECALQGSMGTVITVGAVPASRRRSVVGTAARWAESVLSPRIVQSLISTYESGEPVIAGSWRISQAGVAADAKPEAAPIPWTDIREITVASEEYRGTADPPSLVTATVGAVGRGRPQRLRLSLSGVRNGLFVPRFLDYVAARHGVPLRRAVVRPGQGG